MPNWNNAAYPENENLTFYVMELKGLVHAPPQSDHQMAAAASRAGRTISGVPRWSWAPSSLPAVKLNAHTEPVGPSDQSS